MGALDHDALDLDLAPLGDAEGDADVPVGEPLHVGGDGDLEVALLLVVVLELLRRAVDVDGVVDAAELEVDLLLERRGVKLLVAGEDDVADEGSLDDREDQPHPALEVLHLELHVVEEAQGEDVPDVVGETGGDEGVTDLGGHAAEDDRLLHAPVPLDGDVLDDDRPWLALGRGLR